MDKLDIEIFIAVINEGNIQRAANVLYLSPSTVGTRLKMLEKELGIELISRQKGKKEIILTTRGEEFVPIANNLIANFNECNRLNTYSISPSISIATVDSMIGDVFAPLYRNIVYNEPHFKLNLKCYPADMIYSIIEKKKSDIGFALYEIKNKDIYVTPLFSDPMVVVMSPNNKINKKTIHTSELDPTKEIKIGKNNELYRGWGPQYKIWHGKNFDNSITPAVTTTSITFSTFFFKQGDFWSIIPKSNALGNQERFGYNILELENPAPDRVCYMITHKSQTSSSQKNIASFTTYLESYLEELKSNGIMKILY